MNVDVTVMPLSLNNPTLLDNTTIPSNECSIIYCEVHIYDLPLTSDNSSIDLPSKPILTFTNLDSQVGDQCRMHHFRVRK